MNSKLHAIVAALLLALITMSGAEATDFGKLKEVYSHGQHLFGRTAAGKVIQLTFDPVACDFQPVLRPEIAKPACIAFLRCAGGVQSTPEVCLLFPNGKVLPIRRDYMGVDKTRLVGLHLSWCPMGHHLILHDGRGRVAVYDAHGAKRPLVRTAGTALCGESLPGRKVASASRGVTITPARQRPQPPRARAAHGVAGRR